MDRWVRFGLTEQRPVFEECVEILFLLATGQLVGYHHQSEQRVLSHLKVPWHFRFYLWLVLAYVSKPRVGPISFVEFWEVIGHGV
jgi:hypothetical protein